MSSSHEIFEQNYLNVREKEGRVYTDVQVKSLPFISPNDAQKGEWKLRTKTTNRFLEYLADKSFGNVLDLGCGNGWFTHQIARSLPQATVLGADINNEELQQASRCFQKANLSFRRLDIFSFNPSEKFDLITVNAAIQYFPDVEVLITKIKSLLSEKGEFHVLDSPVYENQQMAKQAAQRSTEYYQKMDVSEMVNSYHHHIWDDFRAFEILYLPKKSALISRILKDSPFPWLRLKK